MLISEGDRWISYACVTFNGRSAEAEHRAILKAAVLVPDEPSMTVARRFLQEIADDGPDSADMIRAQRQDRALRSL